MPNRAEKYVVNQICHIADGPQAHDNSVREQRVCPSLTQRKDIDDEGRGSDHAHTQSDRIENQRVSLGSELGIQEGQTSEGTAYNHHDPLGA